MIQLQVLEFLIRSGEVKEAHTYLHIRVYSLMTIEFVSPPNIVNLVTSSKYDVPTYFQYFHRKDLDIWTSIELVNSLDLRSLNT